MAYKNQNKNKAKNRASRIEKKRIQREERIKKLVEINGVPEKVAREYVNRNL